MPALLLTTALVISATAARAENTVTSDVRCMLTLSAVASDPNQRQAAVMGIYYFAGRIKAQNPGYNFGPGLKAEGERMTVADFQKELKPCGDQMKATAAALEAAQTVLKDLKVKK
jgi:hypothetical protein